MRRKFLTYLLVCSMAVSTAGFAAAAEETEGISETEAVSGAEADSEESGSADDADAADDAESGSADATDGGDADTTLSDDIYSFQIKIDGELYQFPMSWADFTAHGWEYQSDASAELSPNSYSVAETFKKGNLEVYTQIVNFGLNTQAFSECTIAGISIDNWQFSDAPDTVIELPGGITYGVSTLEDVKAAYGEPSDTYDGELYTKLSYRYDYYQEWSLYIEKETGVLYEVELENMIADEATATANEAAAAEVSDEPTEEVLAYTAPTELGDDPLSFTVDYAGALYQLPAPVSVFEENGWTIKEEDSDNIIAGGDFGWVYMMKDNQEYHTTVRNYSKNAATLRNCFVTTVEAGVYDANLPITIPTGITSGMSGDEALALLEGISYETETSGSFTYYNIVGESISRECVQIVINEEENTVTSIEVSHEPKTLDE
ncbi:hypothetical protein [Marvinbryantia formatexigens]|nr:hypothetical protein [Marvinbryantia formatexigens]UWO25765.1 hypothetical protein NQ534_04605 [Marvinbryantia formatexigens DSM 14469]SDF36192.1 hypothetical protein SAMN05660368_00565 [Marvinbryantia formatexigens]